ncbi:MAG TPA: hypothetical protein PKG56_00045 [Chitinophagaceae bacterium]|nr:hypothetical protein [Chitinophagaceae bacterium]HNL81756.1 hypothetical protein [Chitinophagaceae bacterium]
MSKSNKIKSTSDEKIQYYRDYYNENREKLLKKASEKVVCDECSAIVCRSRLSNHKKGKLHDRKVAQYNILKNNEKLKKKIEKLNS